MAQHEGTVQSRAEQSRPEGPCPPLDPPCFCSMGHGLLTIDRGGPAPPPLDPHDFVPWAVCCLVLLQFLLLGAAPAKVAVSATTRL